LRLFAIDLWESTKAEESNRFLADVYCAMHRASQNRCL
jgi:hypothetical protein